MEVLISDFEIISALGCDKETFWKNLEAGVSGVSDISDRLSKDFPIQQAAVVLSHQAFPEIHEMRLRSEVERSFDHHFDRLCESGLEGFDIDGIIWCSSQFGRKITDFRTQMEPIYESFVNSDEFKSHLLDRLQSHQVKLRFQKAVINQSNACITGVTALQSAFKRIQAGEWSRALVFLHEARCREWILSPYLQMRLLSHKSLNGKLISSPFSKDRSGFVKGEGSALFLLESRRAAEERKARPMVSILGCSALSDGSSLTRMSETGESAQKMLSALFKQAQVQKDQVDYINGYGSASTLNDRLETSIYKNFFQERAPRIPISVGKPQFGHLNSAAVGLELASVILMMKNRTLAPTINLENPDPECDLDYVPLQSRKQSIRIALKMAFGFGWSNAGILLENLD